MANDITAEVVMTCAEFQYNIAGQNLKVAFVLDVETKLYHIIFLRPAKRGWQVIRIKVWTRHEISDSAVLSELLQYVRETKPPTIG